MVKVAPRSVKTSDVKQRGQNNQEDNIGIERDLGQMGQQGENHSTDEEHDGIRNFETLGECGQPSDQEHKKEKCELEVVNACGLHGALSRDSSLIHRVLTAAEEFADPPSRGCNREQPRHGATLDFRRLRRQSWLLAHAPALPAPRTARGYRDQW